EALRRADAYHQAGADAILIHSARTDPAAILEFQREGGDRLPVVIVPTKYHRTPTQGLSDAGLAVVIWANHLIHLALASMQRTARELSTRESLHTVEPAVAPLEEVFRLQDAAELERAEKRYLPAEDTPSLAPPDMPRYVEVDSCIRVA